ncbi:MAG: hypothetical protein RBU37_11175 [Myxococcota bacterium]|jgi:hypothetical protein|nr:hypothetical protein [Myxococcota bacterium]
MPFVAVYVFRQKLRQAEVERVLEEIPATFSKLASTHGSVFPEERVSVALIDGVARNVFSPDSHAKGFQGLDILLLIFASFDCEEDQEELREALEAQFRDRWVTRARIFDVGEDRWHVGQWTCDDDVFWQLPK